MTGAVVSGAVSTSSGAAALAAAWTPSNPNSSWWIDHHSSSASSGSGDDAEGGIVDDDADDGNDEMVEVTIPMSAFLQSEPVRAFLASQGVSPSSGEDTLLQYVPRKIVVQVWPSRVRGTIGEVAEGGYVSFDLQYYSEAGNFDDGPGRYTASYLIVMDLYGDDVRISPTMRQHGDSAVQAQRLHFCALKLRDPTHFVLGGDNNSQETGPAYLWDWQADEYIELGAGRTLNCHDVQWSHEYPGDGNDGAFWMPTAPTPGDHIALINASSGQLLKNVDVTGSWDVNHVQLVELDTIAYVSSRMTNAIYKIDVTSGEVEWICGGADGEFTLLDIHGNKYDAGHSLWHGQHNAEYFGAYVDESTGRTIHELLMFDNMYEMGVSSRMLIVEIDEDDYVAKVVWEYKTGAYTPEYGENDRLPSGNLLGSFWISDYNVTQWSSREFGSEQFDMRIVELVRETQLPAWRASVQGALCAKGVCDNLASASGTWMVYSAERFYTAPIVHGVSCSTDRTLTFSTQNNFKQNNPDPASYEVTVDNVAIASGTFAFQPHWMPATVTVSLPTATGDASLKVTNKWGDTGTVAISC